VRMMIASRSKRETYAKIFLVGARLIDESNNSVILFEELAECVTLDINICDFPYRVEGNAFVRGANGLLQPVMCANYGK